MKRLTKLSIVLLANVENTKCQLNVHVNKMVDKILKPILLYVCEILGFGNIVLIEKLHLKF